MKYIVYEDNAEWERCVHEVEVDRVEHLSEPEIADLIRKEFESPNHDPRVEILNSTTPTPAGGVVGVETRWSMKRVPTPPKPNLTLEDYIHQYVLVGSRGHFAAMLGNTWTLADSTNRAKLETAFPDIFTIPKDLS